MPEFKFKPGPTYRYRKMTFYAMNGFICVEDDRDGLAAKDQSVIINCKDWLIRAKAISDEANKLRLMRTDGRQKGMAQECDEKQRLVQDMICCHGDAKDQGDVMDPEVWKWIELHARKRPSFARDPYEYTPPLPGPLPLGKFTGRTATPDMDMVMAPVKPQRQMAPDRKLILPD